jgi:Syntaxin-like protein
MSFNDMDDVEAQPTSGSYSDVVSASPEFEVFRKSFNDRIYTINSNVAVIHRHIGLIGTTRETQRMRSGLEETTKKTEDLVKNLVPDAMRLAAWDPEEIGPHGKFQKSQAVGDYQKASMDFQNAQKLSIEKQKESLKESRKRARAAKTETTNAEDVDSPSGGRGQPRPRAQEQQQQQMQLELLDEAEITFQEQLIEERERQIEALHDGITDINQVMRQIAGIVVEQGLKIGIYRPPFFC